MRSTAALLALALALAFLAGYSQFRRTPLPTADRDELDALLLRFSREAPAQCEVAPAKLFAGDGAAALLDPGSMYPATATLPLDDLRLFESALASGKPLADPMLDKALAWHRALASADAVADGFFRRGPQIHPGGGSYVRLARRSGDARFRASRWLLDHVPHAHALELRALAAVPGFALDAPRAVVAGLSAASLRALRDREPVVLDEQHILLAHAPSEHGAWSAFSRAAWDRFLESTPYRLAPHAAGVPALARRGRLDWQVDLPRVRGRAARNQALALGGLALLAVGIAALLYARFAARDEEARRRRFMLQTLAHELRTPLTSMALALEALRERFDELPPAAQDALGRLLDDAARLERVVEASRHYLRDASAGRLLQLDPQRVDAVSEWLRDVVSAPATPVDFVPLPADRAARLDLHWTAVCLRNLVENAHRHGQPPVRVELARDGDALVITVSDAGACAFADLDAMAVPFVKGPASAGSGLGLAIVRSLARELGGTLAFAPAPTRFTLRLPGVLA